MPKNLCILVHSDFNTHNRILPFRVLSNWSLILQNEAKQMLLKCPAQGVREIASLYICPRFYLYRAGVVVRWYRLRLPPKEIGAMGREIESRQLYVMVAF
jgi:hypothetical protein